MSEEKYFVVVSLSEWKKNSGFSCTSEIFEEEQFYIWDEAELKSFMVDEYFQRWEDVGDGVKIEAYYYNLPFDPMESEPVTVTECWVYPEDFHLDPSTLDTDSLAAYVKQAEHWDDRNVMECIAELAERSDLAQEWEEADGDNFVDVIRKIQDYLEIDMGA